MDWSIIAALLGAMGGWELVRYLLNRKANKRITEAQADEAVFAKYEHQLDRMNTQIEFKDKRIEDLNRQIEEKEQRFVDQTQRLRESQDREYKAQQELNRTLIENGSLKLELKDKKCIRYTCLKRRPKNEHTLAAEAEAREEGALPPLTDEECAEEADK